MSLTPSERNLAEAYEKCLGNPMSGASKTPVAVPTPASRYGVDVCYLLREISTLVGTLDNRPGDDIARYLRRLADVADTAPAPPAPSPEVGPTYKEMFLDAVWNAFDERHPCFSGDCDHQRQKDCDLAVKDCAREMVEEYFSIKASRPLKLIAQASHGPYLSQVIIVNGDAQCAIILCNEAEGEEIAYRINSFEPPPLPDTLEGDKPTGFNPIDHEQTK